ncbi:MAG: HD domain-containing phosphohydrolase [Myxococcota bacterium]|nr:HD domain-containing phosphohydrolase [Myxococcota bacterium]
MVERERVLFVDDEEHVLKAFERTLARCGFDSDCVADGAAAKEALASRDYAVIATDYRLATEDGLSLINELSGIQPDATGILVTGVCDLDLVLEVVNDHPVSHVVCKPWNFDELNSILRRSVERYWERKGQRKVELQMVETTRAMREQRERFDELSTSVRTEMVEMLLAAYVLKRHESEAHCRRVEEYTRILCTQLGIDDAGLPGILQGALLHDVGMMGVPDSILHKTTPLSPHEWDCIRGHVHMGAGLLAGVPALKAAREVVLHHHERWDGSGYPNAIRGRAISLGGRIFAVADSIDAMLSPKPWRGPMSLDAMVQEILHGSGTLYDPDVVDAFSQVEPRRWITVREDQPEEPLS